MERVGAGELGIDAAGCGERLLAVRDLIGEAISRLELQVQVREDAEQRKAEERVKYGMLDDAIDDDADEVAERIHHPVGGRMFARQRLLVAHEQQRQHRQHDDDGDERDADRHRSGFAERADEARLREQQRQERQQRRSVRQHARGSNDVDREFHRFELGVALTQSNADRGHHLHAVGEAHHHDERRHHVQEQVELESEPAQQPERPNHRDDRRQGGDQHQRDAAEEDRGDRRTEQQAEAVIDDLVALDRIADLELHHRCPGELDRKAGGIEILFRDLLDRADDGFRGFFGNDATIERQHHQRKLTVVGQKLAFDDVVVLQRRDDGVEGGFVLGQIVGNDGWRIAGRVRLATCREHRDDAIDAIGKLQVGGRVRERGEAFMRQKLLAFDDDQHVVFARREAAIDFFVGLEFGRVGAEQLGQAVVDLQPHQACCRDRGDEEDKSRGQPGNPEPDQAQLIQTQRHRKRTWRRLELQTFLPSDPRIKTP